MFLCWGKFAFSDCTIFLSLPQLWGNDQVATIRAQRAFTLALGIEHIFKNGTVQEKKETLSELGSNLTLKEKKLSVCNTGVYKIIIDGLLTAKAKNSGFEPENIQDTSSLNDVFSYQYKPLLRG